MTKLIALLVEDDAVFALPAWHRTIPLLERKGLVVTHVAVIPSAVSKYQGVRRAAWYVRTFGVGHALRLGVFRAFERKRRAGEPRTWEEMAQEHGLVLQRFESPAGEEFDAFLRSSHCDVLHVLTSAELSPEILSIPRTGVIAQHSSMLPSCRGLFPYFWARMHGEPMGQSLQQIGASDPVAGPLLAQQSAHPRATRSMLAFQVWAAKRYPEMALDATHRLLARRSIPEPAGVGASYHGLPTRRDRVEFESRGGCLSTWRDLRLTLARRSETATLSAPPAPPRTAYQFPDVLPLRINTDSPRQSGRVIPMRPRLSR